MKKITVLGAGLVGKAIAIDLCSDFKVTSVDINPDNLNKLNNYSSIKKVEADLSRSEILKRIISDCDLVIGAVPGFMGYQTLKTAISCGVNIVDISFFNEDPFTLDIYAIQNRVVAVIDCGVAPGMSNLILGYHNSKMQIKSFECLVGGLPVVRTWPYEYKASFSPIDVIAEYTRPARMVENGAIVVKPALSEAELIHFHKIGTLEAFNTDGLRTLLKTVKIPDMKEKTLRYPGHINVMRVLRETGFFNDEPIDGNSMTVRPIDMTAKLLFPFWELNEFEAEFTVMRIAITGKERGVDKKYTYNLLDYYNPQTQTSSMARTTGYTCTAVARLILENKFSRIGINPPEYIGADEKCFQEVMAYQEARSIFYRIKRST